MARIILILVFIVLILLFIMTQYVKVKSMKERFLYNNKESDDDLYTLNTSESIYMVLNVTKINYKNMIKFLFNLRIKDFLITFLIEVWAFYFSNINLVSFYNRLHAEDIKNNVLTSKKDMMKKILNDYSMNMHIVILDFITDMFQQMVNTMSKTKKTKDPSVK